MASGFEVDVHALRALARDLGHAAQAMEAARGQLGAAAHGGTGDASLDRACGEFQHKWGYGLHQLERTTGAFVTGLEDTAKAYQKVEDEIVRVLHGCGGGLSGGTGTGSGGGTRIPPPRLHDPLLPPTVPPQSGGRA